MGLPNTGANDKTKCLSENVGRHTGAARFLDQRIAFIHSASLRRLGVIKTALRFFLILLKLRQREVVAALFAGAGAAIVENALLNIADAVAVQLYAPLGGLYFFVQCGEFGAVIRFIGFAFVGRRFRAVSFAEPFLFAVFEQVFQVGIGIARLRAQFLEFLAGGFEV